MFDMMDDYSRLFEKRMEGLLLGEDLEEAIHIFDESKKTVTSCQYDYLDYRNNEFDKDYQIFEEKTNALRLSIGNTIEANFSSVWETPQGIKFLARFEKVSEKIRITKLSEKYDRVLKYCEKEVDKITKMFKRQREDPPLPRNFSPVAGRIKWSRCLMQNMTETVESVYAHNVLQSLPATADMVRKYTNTSNLITNYEETMTFVWMNQNLWDVDDSLNNTLLKIDESGRINVNLDQTIKLLIRESDCLVKMGVDLPIVCQSLYAKKNYFTLVNDSLQVGNNTNSKTCNNSDPTENEETKRKNKDENIDIEECFESSDEIDEEYVLVSVNTKRYTEMTETIECTFEFEDSKGYFIEHSIYFEYKEENGYENNEVINEEIFQSLS